MPEEEALSQLEGSTQEQLVHELRRRNDLREEGNKLAKRNNHRQAITIAIVLIGFSLSVIGIGAAVRLQLTRQNEGRSIIRQIENTAEDVKDIVEVIEFQTSEEGQREQQEELNQIFIVVDCNNRLALQQFADNLIAQGIVEPFSVINNCPPTEGAPSG